MAVTQLTPASPDGASLGQSSADLVGMYGATPIAQRSSALQARVTTTAIAAANTSTISPVTTTASVFSTTPLSTTPFGFSSLAAAQALVANVNALVADMAAHNVAVSSLITQSNSSGVTCNAIITRQYLINLLANELRDGQVAIGQIKGS